MKLTCAIIDDEPLAVELLESYVRKTPFLELKGAYNGGITALVVSAIANDGVLMNPYLIDHTENYNGIVVDAYEPTEYGTLLSAEDASLMQTFMREVVEDGTGERLLGQSYAASGKTGTAEFSTSSKASHAWFVGYAHREDKEDIAVAVIVEDSGSGSEYAVPIAKKIFDAYYQ